MQKKKINQRGFTEPNDCQMWPKANFDQISKFHFLKF